MGDMGWTFVLWGLIALVPATLIYGMVKALL